MSWRQRLLWCVCALVLILTFGQRSWAQTEERIDLVGNIYCRSSSAAGERPWGGIRVYVKGRPDIVGESDPEHGRFRLTLAASDLLEHVVTLVYAQSNLLLREEPTKVIKEETMILAGRPTAQIPPRVFVVPYCVELETPRLREMVRALVDQISHRAAVVHEELVRAHRFGSAESARCLDDVLSRIGAHLRHAESRVPSFIDALGDDMLRARREVTSIKIADERAQELAAEADYCLEHHAPHPGQDTSRYLPDLAISPAQVTKLDFEASTHPPQWDHEGPAQAVVKAEQDLVVSKGAAFETGYDSNFLQRNSGAVIPGWQFRPTTNLTLKYFDRNRVIATPSTELPEPTFEAKLSVLGLLLSATNDNGAGLSGYSDLGVSADLLARLLGDGPTSAFVFGQYARRVEPRIEPEHQFTIGQNDFRLGGDISLNLGSGQFDVGAGYQLGVVLHDNASQSFADRMQHRIAVHERLKFLPESALVHETEVRISSFLANNGSFLHSGSQLRSLLGVIGMLGDRFGFQALIGWGQSDYSALLPTDRLSNFDGLIGRAKLEWFFGPVAKPNYGPDVLARPELSLGFDRDYRDHILTDYYRRDRGSLQLVLTNGTESLWRFAGGVSHIAYPGLSAEPTNGAVSPGISVSDTEYRIDASAAVEYRLYGALRLTSRVEFSRNLSEVTPVDAGGASAASLGFLRLQTYGGILYRD